MKFIYYRSWNNIESCIFAFAFDTYCKGSKDGTNCPHVRARKDRTTLDTVALTNLSLELIGTELASQVRDIALRVARR